MMTAACSNCRRFANAPDVLEAALPGLAALSSAYAAVRAADGVCDAHERYVAATSLCAAHDPRTITATSTKQS